MTNDNDIRSSLVMKFLHYFITEEGYKPITLHGASDEIWLEKLDGDYKIVRLVSDYIHNDEQMNFDIFKTKRVVKKIKRKTFTFDIPTLNIYFNAGDNANLYEDKHINSIKVEDIDDLNNYNNVLDIFPDMLKKLDFNEEGVKLFLKITDGINKSSKEEAMRNEEIFKIKKPIVTYILMGINILVFLLGILGFRDYILINFGVARAPVINGQIYRLITGAFIHADIMHILFNMYALHIIGTQMESYIGRTKYILVYIFSAVMGSLISVLFSELLSVGASGAIFGLLGSLLVFGYYYRAVLSNLLRNQIVPIIILNLTIGFLIPGIDNAAHIGGLIGGALLTYALGVKYKSSKLDQINGIVMTTIWTLFIIFMVFFKIS